MNTDITNVLNMSVYVIYFMLPAYLANVAALSFGGGLPVDFGKSFKDGRRIIGDGVTWRGLIIGTLIGTLIGFIQGMISGNLLEGVLLGLFLGGGALIGDACGSFIKRRIHIERGKPAPGLDQLDFVVGALFFASIIVVLPFEMIILIIIITVILHISANMIAYAIGLKDVWY
ncbi:MAG: CDP-2,3-bis-(O-geranylgeranyl)-sn-glycerol synthase [Methanomicrobiales archaeon]